MVPTRYGQDKNGIPFHTNYQDAPILPKQHKLLGQFHFDTEELQLTGRAVRTAATALGIAKAFFVFSGPVPVLKQQFN